MMPSARDAVAAAANATMYRTEHRVIRGPAILPVRTTRTNWRDRVGGPSECYGRRRRKRDLCAQLTGVRHASADYPAAAATDDARLPNPRPTIKRGRVAYDGFDTRIRF